MVANFNIFEFRNNTLGKIYFHELDVTSSLKHRRKLKLFLASLFQKEKTAFSRVDIIFCSDPYLLNLNKGFLDHHYFTDTLSFVLSAPGEPVAGELYLSIDSIKGNTTRYLVAYQEELVRVIIHSCLHLCGYLDKPATNNTKMIKRQEAYLKRWNVSRET